MNASRMLGSPVARRLMPVLTVIMLSFVGAVLWSWWYWGYALAPPESLRAIRESRALKSATFIDTALGASGRPAFVSRPAELAQWLEVWRRDDEIDRRGPRHLAWLMETGRLTDLSAVPSLPDAVVGPLHALLDDAGILEEGDPGYPHAKQLRGVVMELEGAAGEPLLAFEVDGLELSNDHRPHYEAVFRGSLETQASKPTLVASQRIYFDVAGIEGFEWPQMFVVLLVVFSVLGTVVRILSFIRRPRAAQAAG